MPASTPNVGCFSAKSRAARVSVRGSQGAWFASAIASSNNFASFAAAKPFAFVTGREPYEVGQDRRRRLVWVLLCDRQEPGDVGSGPVRGEGVMRVRVVDVAGVQSHVTLLLNAFDELRHIAPVSPR